MEAHGFDFEGLQARHAEFDAANAHGLGSLEQPDQLGKMGDTYRNIHLLANLSGEIWISAAQRRGMRLTPFRIWVSANPCSPCCM
jgi:hypothetical protein